MKIFTLAGEMNEATVTAFVAFYEKLEPDDIFPAIFIDSPGGSVSVAATILSIMEDSPQQWITYCGGHACSAALLVLAGGQFRFASTRSFMMYHDVQVMAIGTAEKITTVANATTSVCKELLRKFAKSTYKTLAFWRREAKKAEGDFYFTGTQSLEFGVVDELGMPILNTGMGVGVSSAK